MDKFEKVERLVQKTGVSYEDAKNALEQANEDLLDAMIILEKQGKVKQPEQAQYSTSYTEQTQYKDVPAVIEESKKTKGKSIFKDIGNAIKRGFRYTVDNSIKVVKDDDTIIKLPLWISIILLLCAWELLVIVIIVSLFLGCKYSVEGKDDSKGVNDILNQASDLADKAKESFNNTVNSSEGTVNDEAAAASSIYRSESTSSTSTGSSAVSDVTSEVVSDDSNVSSDNKDNQ